MLNGTRRHHPQNYDCRKLAKTNNRFFDNKKKRERERRKLTDKENPDSKKILENFYETGKYEC